MMDSAGWYTAIGALLITMALAASLLQRLPITTGIVYLGAGVVLGRAGWLDIDPVRNRFVVETLAEAAVLISLFAAGLKVRAPLRDRLWRLPLRMASAGMVLTIAMTAIMGRWLGLSWSESILLGAILAPTDPVLASDVQLAHAHDTDRLRFTLTGEAGLNDGAAFPFVMLGLGALGLHEVGPFFSRWALLDLLWPVAGGLVIGGGMGTAIARLTLFLRRSHKEAVGLDDFLALGLIGLSYGTAVHLSAYGFLAVFAAGLALRRVERMEGGRRRPMCGCKVRRPISSPPIPSGPPRTWPRRHSGSSSRWSAWLRLQWWSWSAPCSRASPTPPSSSRLSPD